MRVLITGGAGFIGSNLVKQIYKKTDWEIDIVDYRSKINGEGELISSSISPLGVWGEDIEYKYSWSGSPRENIRVSFYEEDIEYPRLLEKIIAGQYDAIFHLAAEPSIPASFDFPVYAVNNNITKTVKLISAVAKSPDPKKVTFVFSSSCAVYGSIAVPSDGISEYSGKLPISPYALQKSYIEDYLDLISLRCGLNVVSLRYFNVYGPGQQANSAYSSVMTAWASASIKNLPLQIHGDGLQTRDMIYVSDVCDANIAAALCKGSHIFNIGTGIGRTTSNILGHFQNYFPGIEVIEKPPREGDVRHSRANIVNAKTGLNWSPKISFEEGFEKTIEWWLE